MIKISSTGSQKKRQAEVFSQLIKQIVNRQPLLNMLLGNRYWIKFLLIYLIAERRNILGEPAVLLAMRNFYLAGAAEGLNAMGELTQLGGASPIKSPTSRVREPTEEEILKSLSTKGEKGRQLAKDYLELVNNEYSDIISGSSEKVEENEVFS